MTVSFEEFVAVRGAVLLRFSVMLTGEAGHHAEDLVQVVLARVYGQRWKRIAAMEQAGGVPEANARQRASALVAASLVA